MVEPLAARETVMVVPLPLSPVAGQFSDAEGESDVGKEAEWTGDQYGDSESMDSEEDEDGFLYADHFAEAQGGAC